MLSYRQGTKDMRERSIILNKLDSLVMVVNPKGKLETFDKSELGRCLRKETEGNFKQQPILKFSFIYEFKVHFSDEFEKYLAEEGQHHRIDILSCKELRNKVPNDGRNGKRLLFHPTLVPAERLFLRVRLIRKQRSCLTKESAATILGVQSWTKAHALILCFSLVDRASFDSILNYFIFEARLRKCVTTQIFLVGTNKDLREKDNRNHISTQEGMKLKSKIAAAGYFECSSKTLEGIEQMHNVFIRAGFKDQMPYTGDDDCCCLTYCVIQ